MATATLLKKDLWQTFNNLQNEMIITKSGRRMFPMIRTQFYHLEPTAYYCVLLEMVAVGKCRYKYSASCGWGPAGAEEAQSLNRVYLHPESPATGEHWMSQPISFGRLKLTNTPTAPAGHVVLSSMHRYQPRLVIVKTADPRNLAWAPSTCVIFPETQFIAVTAYQNEKITKLKIDHNPFAKGFRETGHSKCRRKRALGYREEDEEVEVAKRPLLSPKTDVTDEGSSSRSLSPEPPMPPISENHQTNPRVDIANVYDYPTFTFASPYFNRPNYELYSRYLASYMSQSMASNFAQSTQNCDSNNNHYSSHNNVNYPVYQLPHRKVQQEPKQFTDFSINSIMKR